ncbi:hypothetical protein ACJX0J_019163, partial [Zea mays]
KRKKKTESLGCFCCFVLENLWQAIMQSFWVSFHEEKISEVGDKQDYRIYRNFIGDRQIFSCSGRKKNISEVTDKQKNRVYRISYHR